MANFLDRLLEPYRHAVSGDPTTQSYLDKDPLYSQLFAPGMPQGSPSVGGAPGGSGLMELIYNAPGHYSHLHAAMAKGIVPLGRKLQSLGFDVGEHPKFGGVDPVHSENSHHYNNDAIDVNYNGAGRWESEDQALSWLDQWLQENYG